MDVNERVPLMNKIVTYSWAIIGIVIQVGFLMCKSYYLKKTKNNNSYFCTSSPLTDQ